MNFSEALAQHDVRALSDADVPADDTGWDYARFIPGDRVARDCYLDGDHRDAYFDAYDRVMRCVECDTPVLTEADHHDLFA